MSLTPGSRSRSNPCPSCGTPRFASTIELLSWAKRAGQREAILAARAAGVSAAWVAAIERELAAMESRRQAI